MKYRKKPIIIEAFQYDGDLINSKGEYYIPDWAIKAHEEGILAYGLETDEEFSFCDLFIETPEGIMRVGVGDYVIQGVNGEIYPCKPDIFEKSYDKVEE